LQRDLKKAQRKGQGPDVIVGLQQDIAILEAEIEGKDPPPEPTPKAEPFGAKEEALFEEEKATVEVKSDGGAARVEPQPVAPPRTRQAAPELGLGGIREYIESKRDNFRKELAAREAALATRVRAWLIVADEETKTRHKNALNSDVAEISRLESELATLWDDISSQIAKGSVDISKMRRLRVEKEEKILSKISSKRHAVEARLMVAVGTA
jgi:hypothetical protein